MLKAANGFFTQLTAVLSSAHYIKCNDLTSVKKNTFRHPLLPYFLIAPQLVIILVFFIWPAIASLQLSFYLEGAFGGSQTFVGLQNYVDTLFKQSYLRSFLFTIVFSSMVTFLSLAVALLLAVKADRILRASKAYKTLIIWPYAIAPAVAGIIAVFLFDAQVGPLYTLLQHLWAFDMRTDASDATIALILVAVYKQVSINFVYFIAGLKGIPKDIKEAATIDCISGFRRFWTITFPLLAPTTFFLLVINITYAFFDTFAIIDTLTYGGPGSQTFSLAYKVYRDGFVGQDFGGSSAQSVVLMAFVIILTFIQFRYIEKKVHY